MAFDSGSGTLADPYIITTINEDIDLSSLNLGSTTATEITYYRYNNPNVGDWEAILSTTPSFSIVRFFLAGDDTSGTSIVNDFDTNTSTPITLNVTTTAAVDHLSLQIWTQDTSNLGTVTLRLNGSGQALPLAVPGGLSSSGVDSDSATLNWTAVANATGYAIGYRTTAGGGAWTEVAVSSGTETSQEITGLTASTGYDWRIRAEGAGTTVSEWSATQTFTTTAAGVAFGFSVVEASTTDTSITLRIVGATGTVNCYLSTNDFVSSGDTTLTRQGAGDVTFTGLTASTQYWLYASTTALPADTTQGAPSGDVITETTSAAAPAGPDGTENNPYIITDFGTDIDVLSQLRLGTRGGPTYFAVEDPAAGAWTVTFDTTPDQDWDTYLRARDGTTTQSTDSEIVATTPHTQTVTANAQTDSLQFEAQFWAHPTNPTAATLRVTAPTTTLAVPGSLSSSGVDNDSATLNWAAVANADGYTIGYRTTAGGGAWTDVAIASGTTTSREITGLTASTGYDWRIRAEGSGNFSDSAYSATQTFTTTAAPAQGNQLAAPTNLRTSNITASTAVFMWDAVANAETYRLEARIQGGNFAEIGTTTGLVTAASLNAEGNYEWRVRAEATGFTTSEWSAIESFSTPGAPAPTTTLAAPGSLSSSGVDSDSATLNWGAVANADGYTIGYRTTAGGGAWTDVAIASGHDDQPGDHGPDGKHRL